MFVDVVWFVLFSYYLNSIRNGVHISVAVSFQQIVGIPICAPLLADIFLYSYEAEFIVFALNWKEKISISDQLHIQIHRWRIVNQ